MFGKNLKKYNIGLDEIKYIFLTHAHDDHAGFLNDLLDVNVSLEVIMSNKSMETLETGQNSFSGGCSSLLALIFCKLMSLIGKGQHKFPPIKEQHKSRCIEVCSQNISEVERKLEGKIINTAGHTVDSISLAKDDIIFCGDAAMNGFPSFNRVTIWVWNKNEFKKSWDRLMHTEAKIIYPAHGKEFEIKDLKKYINKIDKIKLHKLH